MNNNARKRLVFISHRHQDEKIAHCIATFLRSLSGARIDVFNSSSAKYQGPRLGRSIEGELKTALATCGIVILVYTDPSADWGWCMWECGVATNPNDQVPTRVIVFSFCGDDPRPYLSNLNVRVVGAVAAHANDQVEAPSSANIVQNRETRGTAVTVERFVYDFCRGSDFFPDDCGPVAADYSDSELQEQAQRFQAALAALAPISEAKLEELIRQVAQDAHSLSAEARNDRLLPLIANCVRALRWGESGPHKPLFDTFWRTVCHQDVAKAAREQLIFRPPTVLTQWEKLMEFACAQTPPDASIPWIRLVSGERSADPTVFWREAMQAGTDAALYEAAVRKSALYLAQQHGRNCVERRFLFEQNYFRSHPDAIGSFESVVKWMSEARITVSVARIEDAGEPQWCDFAILGGVAVSRFQDLGRIENRSLIEDFSTHERDEANAKWYELIPRWHSAEPQPFDDRL
jgi:hypothetical protein